MKSLRFVAVAAGMVSAGIASGQATVPYASAAWQDFGTATDTSVLGNFLPGWRTGNATPDLGFDVFGRDNTTLTGAPNDAAVWLNHHDPSSFLSSSNETVILSLSGFEVGTRYTLTFSATLLRSDSADWTGTADALDIAITGADIDDYDTEVLTDPVSDDGQNEWVAQSIAFIPLAGTVEFEFGGNPEVPEWPDVVATRFGIDGFAMVPGPSSSALLGAAGVCAGALGRRRRG